MNQSTTEKSNLFALLIGIDYYLPNELSNGRSYPSLSGCVRDINHVEDFLVQDLKVPKRNIYRLTSSNSMNSKKPPEHENELPTYQNMINAFKKVTNTAQRGDEVYIHYSGHGGRAATIYPDLKTEKGLDETLVPLDIGNSECRYLRDIEIAHILKTMVEKGLVVTMVLDSCHSGGATRAVLDKEGPNLLGHLSVRGISAIDHTTRPTDSLVAPAEELVKITKNLTIHITKTDNQTRGFEPGSGWLPRPIGYTLIAACEPQESAHEAAFDAGDERNGALTYFLLKTLRKKIARGTTYREIHNELLTKIHTQFRNQTPMLEGEGDRQVFGNNKIRLKYAVNVKEVDLDKKRVLLDAGKIHGINLDAQFAVYPAGSNDFSQIDKRLAIVEIDEIYDTDSYAKIIHELGPNQMLEEGAQAVLIDSGKINLKKKVRLVLQESNKKIPIEKQKEALYKIENALPEVGKGFLDLVDNNNTSSYNNQKPDFQIVINENGEYEILDPSGLFIENVRPPIKIEDTSGDAAKHVVKRLVHLVNYNNIQELDNPDSTSSLSNEMTIELFGLPEDYDSTKRPTPDKLLELEIKGNVKIVKIDQKLALRIQNKLPKVPDRPEQNVMKVTVLDLQPDFGIQQIYPMPDESDYKTLDPESDDIIAFQANLPSGYNTGKDILKVFGAFEPTNFRWLELPPLDQPQTRGSATLRSSAHSASNQLEKLMSDITPENAKGISLLVPTSYTNKGWTVAQLEVQINNNNSGG